MPRREKSPGLKILWIWTFGTAASTFLFLPLNQIISLNQQITHTLSCLIVVAVLIANVMRTRIRDFQSVMDAEEQQQQQQQQNDNGISEDRIIDS
jgi:hypothetical protein